MCRHSHDGFTCVECSGVFWDDDTDFTPTACGPVCENCVETIGLETVSPSGRDREQMADGVFV